MTEGPRDETTAPPRGIRASAKEVVAHTRTLVRLQKELARYELEQKGATVGGGAALAVAAAILAFFALGFLLATIAAALALVVPWWAALLIVFVLLVLLVVALAFGSRSLFQEVTPLTPEQALEEARLTKQVLRGTRAE